MLLYLTTCTGRGEDEQLNDGLFIRRWGVGEGSDEFWEVREREVLWRRRGRKPLRWRGEGVFSSVTYKPFFIFFGGSAVAASTEKNHMSTIISGWLDVLNNSYQQD